MTIVIPHIHPQLPDHLESVFQPSKVLNKTSTVEELKIAVGQKEVIDYLRARVKDQEEGSE